MRFFSRKHVDFCSCHTCFKILCVMSVCRIIWLGWNPGTRADSNGVVPRRHQAPGPFFGFPRRPSSFCRIVLDFSTKVLISMLECNSSQSDHSCAHLAIWLRRIHFRQSLAKRAFQQTMIWNHHSNQFPPYRGFFLAKFCFNGDRT